MIRLNPWLRFASLALLFALTRNHAWTPFLHLPDASLAVLFLTGAVIPSGWAFSALLGLGAGVDAWAITQGGVSAYCITPAYVLLLPASATLWYAGLSLRRELAVGSTPWVRVGLTVSVATTLAELWSSGGFYFLSGRFPHPTLGGFLPRLWHYGPSVLGATLCYIGLVLFIGKRLMHTGPEPIHIPASISSN
ncbi:hypothetical protein FEMY_06940 [Ferrovum myxofaciens]|uniref:Rod shape-determining protein MreD n=1 Tax=Ferrovum myxofaciens TaxID=416213 RepID=A0A149VZM8_9PROT|nr:hypothetical protein [Ferrovum myxofaciens]KXW58667.1 hypothetical protein FEMY_06940 [Ferrovum myxofaciens]